MSLKRWNESSFQQPANRTEPKLDPVCVSAGVAFGSNGERHPREHHSDDSCGGLADRHSPIRRPRDLDWHSKHPTTDPFLEIEVLVLGTVEPGERDVIRMPVEIAIVERLEKRDNALGANGQYRGFFEDHRTAKFWGWYERRIEQQSFRWRSVRHRYRHYQGRLKRLGRSSVEGGARSGRSDMVTLRKFFIAGAAVLGAFVLPATANAQQAVTAYTSADLNLRDGPGTYFRVILAMPRGSQVQVSYCSNEDVWCFVQYGQNAGWASSRYLTSAAPQYAQQTPEPQYQQPQYQQPQYQKPQQQVAVVQPQPPAPVFFPQQPQAPVYQPAQNVPVGAVPYPYYRPYTGFGAWMSFWFR